MKDHGHEFDIPQKVDYNATIFEILMQASYKSVNAILNILYIYTYILFYIIYIYILNVTER